MLAMFVVATICHVIAMIAMIASVVATLPPATAVHVGTVLRDVIRATLFVINIETNNIGGEGTLVRGREVETVHPAERLVGLTLRPLQL